MAIASSSRAWCGWLYGTTACVRSIHPSPVLPAPLASTISTIDVHMPALLREVLPAERPHLLPAVDRLLDPVGRAVVIEEAVAGPVIAVELVVLARLLQLGLVLVDLLRGRGAVLVAEQAEERARQPRGQGVRRDRLLLGQLVLHHPAAPQLDRAVDALLPAGEEEGLAPARAGAEQPDLAVVPRLAAQPLHRGLGVADHLVVGNAAGGARLRGDVVGLALAEPLVKVMADRRVAVMGEAAGALAVPFVPAGHMVNEDHARERAGTRRPRGIGRDRVAIVADDPDGLRNHAFVGHTCLPSFELYLRPSSSLRRARATRGDRAMGPRLVDYLLYEPEESGILWIKFNRPDRMNALVGTSEENGTVAKVGEYMRAGDDDPNVRVIVLTGVGRGFCSGANLGSRAGADITGENFPGNRGAHEGPDAARQHFFHGFTDLHRDISLIRKPTIAMINGAAVGSGMDMALHCDIRIGCEKTRLIGYHNAGQIFENGGCYYLPKMVGLGRALTI